MDQLAADLRFALRGLARRPGVSLLTVATLAVGLAANAALFSIMDALLLRPLGFPGVERMVRIWENSPGSDGLDRTNVAPANFRDWAAQGGDAFEALAALEGWDANVQVGDAPERVQGRRVSPAFFELLGVRPALGRAFLEEEGEEARRRVAVLGEDLWRRRFGGDPGLLGESILIDGEAYTVAGIAPSGFRFPYGAELWTPLALPAAGAARDRHGLAVIGKLAPGRSLAEARSRLELVAARLAREHPATNASRGVVVSELQRGFEDAGLRPVMAVWQGAAALLLLIACLNVANLTLARASERRQELAVRLALGARPARIVRQLATEGVLTALLAAALSVPLCALATRAVRDHMPAEIAVYVAGWQAIDVDGRTLAFSLACALLAALVFAAWPALRAARPDLALTLREGGRSGSAGRRSQLGRNALVVAEVAGALALLVGAGLAIRTATRLLGGPVGFETDNRLVLQVSLPDARYAGDDARRAFARQAIASLARLPGVERVAAANVLPATGNNAGAAVLPEGEAPRDPSDLASADARAVSAGYLETLGIPLLAGRRLQESDDADAPPVALVSRSMAERYWPGKDPIGRRFRIRAADGPLLTVVGVCGDVVHHWFARRNYPTFYRPYAQAPSGDVAFALLVQGDPETLGLSARKAIASLDPLQPAYEVMSLRRARGRSTIGLQYGAAIMGVLGALALVLALSGVYGVMAYRVGLREAEFGVRLALGATGGDLVGLTLGQAGRLTGAGVAIGLLLAVGLGRGMAAAFAGAVEPDAGSFVVLAALLAAAALGAAWLPARRALAANPTRLLRSQ